MSAKRMTTKIVEKVNELYWDHGLNDREIGEIVGFSQQAIFLWRKRYKNPPNDVAGRPPKEATK